MRHRRSLLPTVLLAAITALPVMAGEFTVRTITIPETKAVFGEVKSRTVVPARARTVEPDPEKLLLYGITLEQLAAKVEGANRSFQAALVREDGRQRTLLAGQTLQTQSEICNLLLTARDGRPVYVRDVASVMLATEPNESRVTEVRKTEEGLERLPAVSLAIAKRPGTNAVTIAETIIHRLEQVRGQIFPEDVEMTVTRDYGETANEKANELLFHLGLATVSIVLLVAFAIG